MFCLCSIKFINYIKLFDYKIVFMLSCFYGNINTDCNQFEKNISIIYN